MNRFQIDFPQIDLYTIKECGDVSVSVSTSEFKILPQKGCRLPYVKKAHLWEKFLNTNFSNVYCQLYTNSEFLKCFSAIKERIYLIKACDNLLIFQFAAYGRAGLKECYVFNDKFPSTTEKDCLFIIKQVADGKNIRWLKPYLPNICITKEILDLINYWCEYHPYKLLNIIKDVDWKLPKQVVQQLLDLKQQPNCTKKDRDSINSYLIKRYKI